MASAFEDKKVDISKHPLDCPCVDCKEFDLFVKEDIRKQVEKYKLFDFTSDEVEAETQKVTIHYVERKNNSNDYEKFEKHLCNKYLNPETRLETVLDESFKTLRIGPSGDVSVELNFEHLDEYVLDCESKGVEINQRLVVHDYFESVRSYDRDEKLYRQMLRGEDMKNVFKHLHDCNCECVDCERAANDMDRMEEWYYHNPKCLKKCCVVTKDDLIKQRFDRLQLDREIRLRQKRARRLKRERKKKRATPFPE